MSVIHRSLFGLVSIALFVVLIALKVDHKSEWNWFVVFIPMYALDVVMAVMAAMSWLRSPSMNRSLQSKPMSARRVTKRLYCVTSISSKVVFEVLLCSRLEYIKDLPLYVTFIPLWVCLISCLTFFATKNTLQHRL